MTNEELEEKIKKLEEETSIFRLQDRCVAQVKEHKEYLQRLLDSVLRTVSSISAVILLVTGGVLGWMGFKTIEDVEVKSESIALERVEELISDRFIENKVQEIIDKYDIQSAIAYALYQTTQNEEYSYYETIDIYYISEKDLLVFDQLVKNPDHEYFDKLLKLFQVNPLFQEKYSHRYGSILTKILVDSFEESRIDIDSITKENILDAIVFLYHEESVKYLSKYINNNRLSISLRIKLVKKLSELESSDYLTIFLKEISNKLESDRVVSTDLYFEKLLVYAQHNFDKAFPLLYKLANSQDVNDLTILGKVVKHLIENNFYISYNFHINYNEQIVKLLSTFFLNEKLRLTNKVTYNVKWQLDGEGFKPLIMLNTGDKDINLSFSYKTIINEVVLESVINGFDNITDIEDKVKYIESIIIPIVKYGKHWFKYEKEFGHIGKLADPLKWQDGFSSDLILGETSKSHEMRLIGFDSEKKELIFSYYDENDVLSKYMLHINSFKRNKLKSKLVSLFNRKIRM